jgi:DNA-binding NtrC family response regulator
MSEVYNQIDRIARIDVPVLLIGESGTGKELVARAIHDRSLRHAGPYTAVNTGAIAQDLVASELFGHEKGSFTGAASRKRGLFEVADGGTLFLDEISTMDMATQVSLLRVLETGSFQRLGGEETVDTDVRIIAATNEDLKTLIQQGRFRDDLYYRLNVFSIHLPRLSERSEDVLVLARHFLDRYADEFSKPVAHFSEEVLDLFERYSWPGNVRELENLVVRAVIACRGDTITVADLPERVRDSRHGSDGVVIEIGTTIEGAEIRLIEETLRNVEGNRSKAAEILGISRKALYNKIKSYRIQL